MDAEWNSIRYIYSMVCSARQNIFRLVINLQWDKTIEPFSRPEWGELYFRYFRNLLKCETVSMRDDKRLSRTQIIYIYVCSSGVCKLRIKRNYSFARDNPVIFECCRRRCDKQHRILAPSSQDMSHLIQHMVYVNKFLKWELLNTPRVWGSNACERIVYFFFPASHRIRITYAFESKWIHSLRAT